MGSVAEALKMVKELNAKYFGQTDQDELRKELLNEAIQEREQAQAFGMAAMPYSRHYNAGPPHTVLYRSELAAMAHSDDAIKMFTEFSSIMFSRWISANYGQEMNSMDMNSWIERYTYFKTNVLPRWVNDTSLIEYFAKKH
jgi:hypothetical protein